jgi:hypothetical protein
MKSTTCICTFLLCGIFFSITESPFAGAFLYAHITQLSVVAFLLVWGSLPLDKELSKTDEHTTLAADRLEILVNSKQVNGEGTILGIKQMSPMYQLRSLVRELN